MFQTLYHRYHDQLDRQSGGEGLFLPYPATYADGMATLERSSFELAISGEVAEPKVFSWKDLIALPLTRQNRRIVSAQGWTYRTQWEGVLLSDLLEKVTLRHEHSSLFLCQVNALGQESPLALEALIQGEALLCYRVNGQLLNRLYGGPLRLTVFDRYSHAGLGYLTELKFLLPPEAAVVQGFWEQKGYPRDAAIQPGDYYAFDLAATRPVSSNGEITEY